MAESQTQLTQPDPHEGDLAVTDTELRRAAQIQMVVDSLAAGRNIKESCAVVGISERTWRSWRHDGYVQDVVDAKFRDMTTGVRDQVANALVGSTELLCALSQGIIPPGTSIKGVLAPRDSIAAMQQLLVLWKQMGGDSESKEREQDRIIEELAKAQISIHTYHIETANIGTEAQPVPVPIGVAVPPDIVEGEIVTEGGP